MDIYCTTKNTGPSWTSSDPLYMVYIGTDLEEAIAAVGDFQRYEREFDDLYKRKHLYTVLPRDVDFEVVRYYMADGFWKTVVKFQL